MTQTMIPALIGLVALVGIPALTQGEQPALTEDDRIVERAPQGHGAQDKQKPGQPHQGKASDGDIDKLYKLAKQARAELQALRVQAGIRGEYGERHREGSGRHGEGRGERRGEHGEGRGERRGEHGGGRGESGKDEEGGRRLGKHETWDATRNGARLTLAYYSTTQSFKGTVQNTSARRLSQVRVEVHLSNGVELGPTKRTDLQPGEKISVELSAANQTFEEWTTHPEHGSEEGHGREGGSGEHGVAREGAAGSRPKDRALRPLYNELLLLQREVEMLAEGLRARGGRDRKL